MTSRDRLAIECLFNRHYHYDILPGLGVAWSRDKDPNLWEMVANVLPTVVMTYTLEFK